MSYLDILQKINDFLYQVLGDNKIVINLQVYINGKRFELDEVDVKEIITEATDGKFVQ